MKSIPAGAGICRLQRMTGGHGCAAMQNQACQDARRYIREGDAVGHGRKPYVKLFLSTFQLSACTFGGGFVIIPLMRRKFVEELHWIEEQEMMDLTAIAQSAPGAIAVNASILVGYRVAGIAGALDTVLGTVLQPLVIISVISCFYAAFRENRIVSMAMSGMLAGVAAVVCDVVVTMGKEIVKRKRVLPVCHY